MKFNSTIIDNAPFCTCNGYHVSLTYNSLVHLKPLLSHFDTIIELGTFQGGFTEFLYHETKERTKIISYDINPEHNKNTTKGIDFRIGDVLSPATISEITNIINQRRGSKLIFCDGGDKNTEFNTYAKIIKRDDFIMVHDFYDERDNVPYAGYKDAAGWTSPAESNYAAIAQTISEYGLVPYMYDRFLPNLIGSFTNPLF